MTGSCWHDFVHPGLFTCLLISFVFVCLTQMTQSGLPELTGVQDLKYVCDALQPQTTDAEATIFFTRYMSTKRL